MKTHSILFFILLFLECIPLSSDAKHYDLTKYGLIANDTTNSAPRLATAIAQIISEHQEEENIVLRFSKGIYHFYPTQELEREYYISNHDQRNPKKVGIPLEFLENIVLDGQNSTFIFHGRMLPISMIHCKNCILKNFSIDFENPHITQLKVVANDTFQKTIKFEVAPWVNYKIEKGKFIAFGKDWQHTPQSCIAFDGTTRHMIYQSSDVNVNFQKVTELSHRILVAENWKDPRLIPGTIIACRTWQRPTPGIFIHHSENTLLQNIQIHYAEGMGLLAQLSTNITLDYFNVCLKSKHDPRYFTTQADATHFSGCKGKIISRNGLYEHMMDDAINVHGTYLKIIQKVDEYTIIGNYIHSQSWGFKWGEIGDTIQFVKSATMELIGNLNTIASITPYDSSSEHGAKQFKIKFTHPLPSEINSTEKFGIENLTWTPEVEFSHNTIRNNRARGTLFSTPKKTIISHNLFDHTSGTAILLCGDCNGWYETGACREVIITHNRFINALTSLFQFTNAIISIYPEIPNLAQQKQYFHGKQTGESILIEKNHFETFDSPILYAKSVQGITFKKNRIKHNQDFPLFHWNQHAFFFEKVARIQIQNNKFDRPFQPEKEIRLHFTSPQEVKVE